MVEYLEIEGKKHPVRIGYYVMKNVKAETGMSLSQALEHSRKEEDLSVHETILFYAMKMGAFAEKTEMAFKREDMEMVLDICFMEYMALFASDKFFPRDKIKQLEKGADKMPGKPKVKKLNQKKI